MTSGFECTDKTKRLIAGDMLVKYYHADMEDRDPKLTEILNQIEDEEEFSDILYYIYGEGVSTYIAGDYVYISESVCKKHRRRMLDKIVKYMGI